jgi:SIT4-associating protein SAP185/190
MNHKDTLLRPFWAAVVPALDDKQPDAWERSERERARLLFWTDADEERERKMEIIRGMWMRVNASFLQKRTTEVS